MKGLILEDKRVFVSVRHLFLIATRNEELMNYNAASRQINTQQNGLHIGRRGFLAAAAMTFPVSQAISG